MQAIELETAIIKGEIHAKLPKEINAEKAKLIVLYEPNPLTENTSDSGLLQLLDEIINHRNWHTRSKEEIDQSLEEERASWD